MAWLLVWKKCVDPYDRGKFKYDSSTAHEKNLGFYKIEDREKAIEKAKKLRKRFYKTCWFLPEDNLKFEVVWEERLKYKT